MCNICIHECIFINMTQVYWAQPDNAFIVYIIYDVFDKAGKNRPFGCYKGRQFKLESVKEDNKDIWDAKNNELLSFVTVYTLRFSKYREMHWVMTKWSFIW